ncbi:TIR domain-containing protein [Candidatus Palauibacter sp.]|uniref:TIR domain-containing protein n=1 Tax=Candidatus Palauibacter sp. TaxID=3101350 RepID=UPI003B0219ED
MSKKTAKQRTYLSQSDVPSYGLDQALRVAEAIANEHGKQPTRPLLVAQAMDLAPGTGHFRMLCGASIAYGLTNGGYNAKLIELTPLGRRIVAPTEEGDDQPAKREAVLRPRVLREFLTRYNESPWPSDNIARNVLEEMGVPGERTERTLKLVRDSAEAVGLLRDIKGSIYVDLESDESSESRSTPDVAAQGGDDAQVSHATPSAEAAPPEVRDATTVLKKRGRVFITHGSDRAVVAQLKDLLTFGGFTPVVALEQESSAKPVPDKVLGDMRSCGAAIIHVGAERRVLDEAGEEHRMLNENVLIEIGAAMALYGRKFILLVESSA